MTVPRTIAVLCVFSCVVISKMGYAQEPAAPQFRLLSEDASEVFGPFRLADKGRVQIRSEVLTLLLTRPRRGSVKFADGKERSFSFIVGIQIPPQENAWRPVPNGDLLLDGFEEEFVIPWDKVKSLTISKGMRAQNVKVTSLDGKAETFTDVASGVEIEWTDSVARSRLSIHDKLLGATILFTEQPK